MSSTWWRVSMRRSASKFDQSAYARRTTTRPRSASASAIGPKSNSPRPRASTRSDRQVLVVEKERDAFFVGGHLTRRLMRRAVEASGDRRKKGQPPRADDAGDEAHRSCRDSFPRFG